MSGNTMLALSVKQPWASLIVAGVKDVENRSWPLPATLTRWWVCSACGERLGKAGAGGVDLHVHGVRRHEAQLGGPCPFRMMIHASKADDFDAWFDPRLAAAGDAWRETGGVGGALLGSVIVTGCHHASDCGATCSRWADAGAWHWTVTDPQPLPTPIPIRGRLGLWRMPADLVVAGSVDHGAAR